MNNINLNEEISIDDEDDDISLVLSAGFLRITRVKATKNIPNHHQDVLPEALSRHWKYDMPYRDASGYG